MALQIVTLNANGLRDENKRMGLQQWLGHLSVDFVCLQETHVLSANEAIAWFSSYGWSSVVSPSSRHSCGTVLLFRPRYQILNLWFDSDGRFVLVEFSFRNVVFRIASLYAPNRNPNVMISLLLVFLSLIPRSPRLCAVISMLFFAGPLTGVLFPPILVGKALVLCFLSSRIAALSISGVLSILMVLVLRGISLTARSRLALILLAALMLGLLSPTPVLSSLALFLTTS